jgi:predicted dehydrogenase
MSKNKIGMISYDHIYAELRSRALKEMTNDVEIVAVADSDEGRVSEAQRKFGGSPYRDYRELLKPSDLDLMFAHCGKRPNWRSMSKTTR